MSYFTSQQPRPASGNPWLVRAIGDPDSKHRKKDIVLSNSRIDD